MIDFLNFAVVYSLAKCIKTMLVGTVFMAAAYAAAKLNRGRSLLVDYYALLLVPLALFSGMSKLFYVHGFVWVSVFLNKYSTPWLGWLYFGVAGCLLLFYIRKTEMCTGVRCVCRNMKTVSWRRVCSTGYAPGMRRLSHGIWAVCGFM